MSLMLLKGDAGNSLAYHNQMQFTTKDGDNDLYRSNCATQFKGAWWYKSCYYSNLNGRYRDGRGSDSRGMIWRGWRSFYSLKKSEMKIRPSQF